MKIKFEKDFFKKALGTSNRHTRFLFFTMLRSEMKHGSNGSRGHFYYSIIFNNFVFIR